MDCIFCKISGGEIPSAKIWEDGDFVAFLDINPINPGHTLIIPKRHVDRLFDIPEPQYSALFAAARRLSAPILKATGAKRMGLVVEGFLVPHAHLHLVPLHGGNELDFRRAKKAPPEELAAMASAIKSAMG